MLEPVSHEPRILGTSLKVCSGKREEVRQTLADLGGHFRAQPGCLAVLILEAPAPSEDLTFLTIWEDRGAGDEHLASEACRILLGATQTLGEPAPFRLPRPEAYPLTRSASAPPPGADLR